MRRLAVVESWVTGPIGKQMWHGGRERNIFAAESEEDAVARVLKWRRAAKAYQAVEYPLAARFVCWWTPGGDLPEPVFGGEDG